MSTQAIASTYNLQEFSMSDNFSIAKRGTSGSERWAAVSGWITQFLGRVVWGSESSSPTVGRWSPGDYVVGCHHGSGRVGWRDPAIARTWDRVAVHSASL